MIIWITGASSGLGREVARQYAVSGHTVCVSARGRESLEQLAEECSAAQGSMAVFPLDVTATEGAKNCLATITAEVGLPDLCIFNAGTHTPNPVKKFDASVFRTLMDVNFMGTVSCLEAIIPVYLEARRGKIAVVSSVAGYRGLPNASAYGASKAALINMCEALQPDLKSRGVDLALINPGFVRTPLTDKNEFPMPFLMDVDKAAERVVRGLAGNRFEITFPRRFTWMVKLLRILPNALYLRLTRNLLKNG